MENKKWKRFGSCLMALAMVLSGTALPASAATPGKDGSAEMNEAYAAHESLMPIGPSFSVATHSHGKPRGRFCREPKGKSGSKAHALLPG